MGRRKLEIKRIEDNNARQMSFTKRRNGLLKKAKELSVLCDVEVAAIIFSTRGKPYHYCSTNNLTGILQRYQSHVEMGEGSSKGVSDSQEQYSKYAGVLSSGELLQIVERELGERCVDQLSVTDLIHLEKQLEDALILTRSTKMIQNVEEARKAVTDKYEALHKLPRTHLLLDSISNLHDKEKMLVEEKRHLEEELAQNMTIGRKNKEIVDLNILAECQIIEE